MKSKTRDRLTKFWRWIRPLLVVVVVMTSFRSAVADWNDVPTGSMNPTILEGDRILVNKLAFDLKVPYTTWRLARWDTPRRGDIVVFDSPADGKRLVKRVVGLPGDSLELQNERLLVNGQAATYEFDDLQSSTLLGQETVAGRTHAMQILPSIRAMRTFGPVTVPAGHYFMMGDNRDNSFDSRYFGPVPMENILGRGTAVILSVNSLDRYQPRWGRFFTKLK